MSTRSRKSRYSEQGDRTIDIFDPPHPTLMEEVRSLKKMMQILIKDNRLLRCEVNEVKCIISNSPEYSDNLTGEPVTK